MDDYFYTITYNEKIFSINDEELLDVIPVRLIIAKLKQIKAKNNLDGFIFNASDRAVKLQEAINYDIKYAYFFSHDQDLYNRVMSIAENNQVILLLKII